MAILWYIDSHWGTTTAANMCGCVWVKILATPDKISLQGFFLSWQLWRYDSMLSERGTC